MHSSHTFKPQTLHNTTRMHAYVASGCPSLCARGRRTRRHAPFSATTTTTTTTTRGWLQQQLVPEACLLRLSPNCTDRQAVPTASGCRGPTSGSTRRASCVCIAACDRVVVVVEVVDGRRMELNILIASHIPYSAMAAPPFVVPLLSPSTMVSAVLCCLLLHLNQIGMGSRGILKVNSRGTSGGGRGGKRERDVSERMCAVCVCTCCVLCAVCCVCVRACVLHTCAFSAKRAGAGPALH